MLKELMLICRNNFQCNNPLRKVRKMLTGLGRCRRMSKIRIPNSGSHYRWYQSGTSPNKMWFGTNAGKCRRKWCKLDLWLKVQRLFKFGVWVEVIKIEWKSLHLQLNSHKKHNFVKTPKYG